MLSVSGLTKWFGSSQVLRSVSFEVGAGDIVAFVGRNGAGKTTALRSIAGHLSPDSGNLAIDGDAVSALDSRIAYLPEIPSVYPQITVWDHLQFVAMGRAVRDWQSTAGELLERLRFAQYRDYLGAELSKGTRQKLLIACACISNAAYLLLDEPLVGLDPLAQEDFIGVVSELAATGRGVVFSTHNLDVAMRMGEKIVLLRDGATETLERQGISREAVIAAL